MAGRLEGKVCVITGAGGGMGADAAEVFTREGEFVIQFCKGDMYLRDLANIKVTYHLLFSTRQL